MTEETENLVLELLRGMRADLVETKAELKADIQATRTELQTAATSLRRDMASDLAIMQNKLGQEHKQTRDQVVGLPPGGA